MKNAENTGRCPQGDSTECKGYAGAQSAVQLGSGETAGRGQKLLEAILYKDNMNNAYKRVKASKGKEGLFIRVHPKALLKAKNKLRALTRRNRGVNVRQVMKEIKLYMTGWLNYYAIDSMKQRMAQWDERLRHRIRAYIWKQWKKPKTKLRNLMKLKVPEYFARMAAYSRRGYGLRWKLEL